MLNWAQLKDKGRCKDIGIPWNDEENAARALGIPAHAVRAGILTLEAFEKAEKRDAKVEAKTGEKKVEKMNKKELQAKATELGVEFTPDATNDALVTAINAKLAEKEDDSDPTAPGNEPE